MGFLATSCHSTSSVSSIVQELRDKLGIIKESWNHTDIERQANTSIVCGKQRGITFIFERQAFVDIIRVVVELLTENMDLLRAMHARIKVTGTSAACGARGAEVRERVPHESTEACIPVLARTPFVPMREDREVFSDPLGSPPLLSSSDVWSRGVGTRAEQGRGLDT